ncbi:AAA family ATPase [Candidatus Borrarchaeum sp.]|uniref:AAA family ATPase n=1 Tax=Candidatus Borrarchaeum sp. TaxID=2846742 RepID=UPI00257A6C61|nr:AAA family ATPase [Candidatus Borrarchaeum sp.]
MLIILSGLPSSGKSTLVNEIAKILELDLSIKTIMIESDGIRNMIPSYREQRFNPDHEPVVRAAMFELIKHFLEQDYIVINDDMNYYKSMRHDLREIALEMNVPFAILYVSTPREVALSWNEKRGLPIPQEVIEDAFNKFDIPGKDYEWDRPLLVVDLSVVNPKTAAKEAVNLVRDLLLKPSIREAKTVVEPSDEEKQKEAIDQLTRKIISETIVYKKNEELAKNLSEVRREFVKNAIKNKLTLDEVNVKFKELVDKAVQNI